MTYLTTYSGRDFNLLEPQPDLLSIDDIAHALSQLCRFTGHCTRFYSVAQHSVLVSLLTPPEHAYCGLMHDITEAVLGDVASPLKSLLPEYKHLEKRVWASLSLQFQLPPIQPPEVKLADLQALAIEKAQLMPKCPDWEILRDVPPPSFQPVIFAMSPEAAKRAFLQRYAELRP